MNTEQIIQAVEAQLENSSIAKIELCRSHDKLLNELRQFQDYHFVAVTEGCECCNNGSQDVVQLYAATRAVSDDALRQHAINEGEIDGWIDQEDCEFILNQQIVDDLNQLREVLQTENDDV